MGQQVATPSVGQPDMDNEVGSEDYPDQPGPGSEQAAHPCGKSGGCDLQPVHSDEDDRQQEQRSVSPSLIPREVVTSNFRAAVGSRHSRRMPYRPSFSSVSSTSPPKSTTFPSSSGVLYSPMKTPCRVSR